MYRKAGEAGIAWAQFRFAAFLESGVGGPKNEAEAAKWYNKAAEQGIRRGRRRWSLSDSKVSAAGETVVRALFVRCSALFHRPCIMLTPKSPKVSTWQVLFRYRHQIRRCHLVGSGTAGDAGALSLV